MLRAIALAGALAIGLTLPGMAQAQTEENPVVAIVNGESIYKSDFTAFYNSLPQQYRQAPLEQLYPQLVEGLIETRLLAQAARAAGMMDDPQVKQRLAYLTNDVLQQSYLDKLLEAELTEERLRAAYQESIEGESGGEEVRARHILLEDEDAAKAVIGELDAGVDFASLAQERSTGPSGPTGGDLGYFTRDQMVAPFAEAAFALNPGEYSSEPVKTEFGWHVIKVEDRRASGPPTFEESQAELSRNMGRNFVLALMADLLKDAEISRFDAQGNAMEAAPGPGD